MTLRRNLLLGGLCAVGLAGAEIMTPRKKVSLLGSAKLTDIAPMVFGEWRGRDVSDLIAPQEQNSLQSRLYGQTVERVYTNAGTGAEIMMLLAHGETQSNDLQLHRPEVCYPAFGFTLTSNRAARVTLVSNLDLPVREIVAIEPGRQENVLYWSRLGEFLPTSGNEQRQVRFANALRGFVADGLLARFSMIGTDPSSAFTVLGTFVGQFILAAPKSSRAALVGTKLSQSVTARGL